jgi:hypothetical protein
MAEAHPLALYGGERQSHLEAHPRQRHRFGSPGLARGRFAHWTS